MKIYNFQVNSSPADIAKAFDEYLQAVDGLPNYNQGSEQALSSSSVMASLASYDFTESGMWLRLITFLDCSYISTMQ